MLNCLYCNKAFEPNKHNQVYHDEECRRLATNARIMRQYYAKKAKKLDRLRKCGECGTVLSQYNIGDYCYLHAEKYDSNRTVLASIVGIG